MRKYSLFDLTSMSNDEVLHLNADEMVNAAKQAANFANRRRSKALNYLREHPDEPVPQAYRETSEYKRTVKGETQRISKRSWKNVDFDPKIPEGATNKEKREIAVSSLTKTLKFLRSKSSTITGWNEIIADFRKKTVNRMRFHYGEEYTSKMYNLRRSDYAALWDLFNTISEMPEYRTTGMDSNQLIDNIAVILEEERNNELNVDGYVFSYDTVRDMLAQKYGIVYISYTDNVHTDAFSDSESAEPPPDSFSYGRRR